MIYRQHLLSCNFSKSLENNLYSNTKNLYYMLFIKTAFWISLFTFCSAIYRAKWLTYHESRTSKYLFIIFKITWLFIIIVFEFATSIF